MLCHKCSFYIGNTCSLSAEAGYPGASSITWCPAFRAVDTPKVKVYVYIDTDDDFSVGIAGKVIHNDAINFHSVEEAVTALRSAEIPLSFEWTSEGTNSYKRSLVHGSKNHWFLEHLSAAADAIERGEEGYSLHGNQTFEVEVYP